MILRDIEARRRKAMEVCFKYFCCAPTVIYLRMDKPPLAYEVFSHTGPRLHHMFVSHIPQFSLAGDGVASRS
jgi:hypothetical protein